MFRAFVASGAAYEKAPGFRIWTERIRPDLQGRRPGLKPLLQSKTKIVPVISKTRGLLGLAGILELEREPIHNVLNKIAKGLYFLDTRQPLPDNVEILAGYFQDPKQLVLPPLDEAIKGAIRVDLGDGVVTYWRNRMRGDPKASITWLLFYQVKVFMICTSREDT